MTFQTIINEIENNLKKILQDLSISDISFSVEVAKPGFGDVSSNIAFLLAKNWWKKRQVQSDLAVEDKEARKKLLKIEHNLQEQLEWVYD